MINFLPHPTLTKTNRKRLKILALAGILVLASTLFLLEGPHTLDLVESRVESGNLPREDSRLSGTVLAQTNEPKLELVNANIPEPVLTAVAAIAYDPDSDKVLYQKNVHARLAPASTTKIMTAIVSSQHFESGDLLTVPQGAEVAGSKMGLAVGETLTFRSLLYGMMLNSGNDAAFTIAMNYPGGFDAFVAKMNSKAADLGLKDTHFDNPAGFDSPTHYSSAYDLLQISREAVKNAKLGHVFSTKETSVSSIDRTQVHVLRNLNKLLGEDGVSGIKTGTTEMAGESFVGLAEKNGRTILTVMLNSRDRFGETRKLIDWIFSNFTWQIN
ncbi:MAG TPA: D-alanyl-D-alanine carboxypeptidase family protein [Patescibacteria group bacterium]|nr:D-alanyl-D-alanine carboxypeptidase family protein [Patescibacteria group bacterium]